VGNGEYKRVVSVSWHLIAILMGLSVLWAFHTLYHSYQNFPKIPSEFGEKGSFGTVLPLFRLVNVLMIVIMFGSGAYFGTIAWSWWPMLFIRTPWDGVILLEINMLILSLGLKLIIENAPTRKISHSVFSKWQYYAGVIFGALGCSGSVTSFLLISVSIMSRGFPI
jgi:hypothetical protein